MCYEKLPKSTLHHSVFSKMVPALKGKSLKSMLGFIKTLYKLGKPIEVRETSDKDKKAETPAKQKPI